MQRPVFSDLAAFVAHYDRDWLPGDYLFEGSDGVYWRSGSMRVGVREGEVLAMGEDMTMEQIEQHVASL